MDVETAERTFEAYRAGLLTPPVRPSKPVFYRVLMDAVIGRIELRERLVFRKSYRATQQGLAAARQGDLETAAERFASSRGILESARPGEACHLLATTFVEAAHAYLEYRHGRLDRARERIFTALDSDLALESDDAFGCLEMHRIQLADNLMMIDFREGLHERGLVLAGSILAYGEGLADSLPIHRGWRPDLVRRAPLSVRKGALGQIAHEVAIVFPKCPAPELWAAIATIAAPLAAPAALQPRVHQWLLAREAWARRDAERFLALLAELLPGGRSDLGAAWYAAVLDFAEHCGELQTEVGDLVRKAILRDVKWWPDLPAPFRPLTTRRAPARKKPAGARKSRARK
ncbi:MAG TPA: hypothetical protein VN493_28805 [Thermoanaerobaculia bacterium]|nr:hypothetical protein [Thermoanaerobaculia bacterium]